VDGRGLTMEGENCFILPTGKAKTTQGGMEVATVSSN